MSAAYRPDGTPRTPARARAAACPPGSAYFCAPRSLLVPLVSVPAAGRDAPVSPPRTSDRAGVTRLRRRNVMYPLSYAQHADPATPAPGGKTCCCGSGLCNGESDWRSCGARRGGSGCDPSSRGHEMASRKLAAFLDALRIFHSSPSPRLSSGRPGTGWLRNGWMTKWAGTARAVASRKVRRDCADFAAGSAAAAAGSAAAAARLNAATAFCFARK